MFAMESTSILAAFVGSGWHSWGWVDYAVVAVAGAVTVIHLARMKLKDDRKAEMAPPDHRQRTWKSRRSRRRKK